MSNSRYHEKLEKIHQQNLANKELYLKLVEREKEMIDRLKNTYAQVDESHNNLRSLEGNANTSPNKQIQKQE